MKSPRLHTYRISSPSNNRRHAEDSINTQSIQPVSVRVRYLVQRSKRRAEQGKPCNNVPPAQAMYPYSTPCAYFGTESMVL